MICCHSHTWKTTHFKKKSRQHKDDKGQEDDKENHSSSYPVSEGDGSYPVTAYRLPYNGNCFGQTSPWSFAHNLSDPQRLCNVVLKVAHINQRAFVLAVCEPLAF